MASQKKLSDEAYANDYVIHKNACADRKLQKQLDHLEKMQMKQRRKLEQEEHYFTVLHRVVPVLQPGDDSNARSCGSKMETRPGIRKRFTEPVISVRKENALCRLKSESSKEMTSPRLRRELLSLRDIAFDAPLSRKEPSDGKSGKSRAKGVLPNHGEPLRPEQEHRLFVAGRSSNLRERRQCPSSRLSFAARQESFVNSRTKCIQYLRGSENYLHDIESTSLVSINGDSEAAEEDDTKDLSDVSIDSNRAERSSSSDVTERFPNIEQLRINAMGTNQSASDVNMLYQLKEGHLDVPKQDVAKNTHCTYATESEIISIEKLSHKRRKHKNSSSFDAHNLHRSLGITRSDPSFLNGTHMTLVKFLPKSKQALFLKNDDEVTGRLCNSWHAGESS